jgi:hypothetical protein
LALAFGAGLALSVSNNDRKALSATARAGRRAPGATAGAARATAGVVARVSTVAATAAMRAMSRDDGSPEGAGAGRSAGVFGHLRDLALGGVAEVVEEMRAASLAINAPRAMPPAAAGSSTVVPRA